MTMDKGKWACAAVLSIALGVLATPGHAAPVLGTNADGIKAALAETSPVEKARWVRRCWRDWRGRHCRRVWIGPRFYGPAFRFYFDGGRRHFRGRGFRGDRFRGGRGFRGDGFRGGRSFRGDGFRGGRSFRGGGGRRR
jgi:hypothetical protein